MSKPLTFNNKQSVKDKYVKRMQQHAEADEVIQGTYWEEGKGCFIGCLMEDTQPHDKVDAIGLDPRLTYLLDSIFEGLSNDEAKIFARDTIGKIPVGVDSYIIYCKFMYWLMERNAKRSKDYPEVVKACRQVKKLYRKLIDGKQVADNEWSAAESAAWSARSAARSAAESAAWSAAWSVEYKLMAKKIHELLKKPSAR